MIRSEGYLEDRVVAALQSRGLVKPERRGHPARAGIAVLIAAFIALLGLIWLEAPRSTDAEGGKQTYVMLLYNGPAYRPAASAESRSREYGQWARDHSRGPVAILSGLELKGATAILGKPTARQDTPSGFFIIRARSRDDALALAKTSPHLRHGGTVVVRETAG